jgi:peptidoglycan glycosyltransferase
MARVAAALANDGVLVEPRIESVAGVPAKRQRLLSPAAARTLARYMRDAVVEGTGRSLRSHPRRIAGKTGTAEVAGAASHSWFVGFAPYQGSARRIAFAVIVENAGYGGRAAASVAC